VVIKHVAHRVHRWHRRPRFRAPKTWIVLALLLLATLLVLPRVSTPPAGPPQLPTQYWQPEPPRQIFPEVSPAPASETHEGGCPKGCTEPPPGCDIKGNISQRTGERIYHLPGQRYYDKTVIAPEDGEAWFCTEAEARENGWRKSKV
jgi:murein DD-endopeptidase MepM/ murein hydrolase activator NlpD